jgi:cysteine desulfurase
LPIAPLVFGGGQEQGLRPGTLNVPGIVGFAEAARLAIESFVESGKCMAGMRDLHEKLLIESFPEIRRNGYLEAPV